MWPGHSWKGVEELDHGDEQSAEESPGSSWSPLTVGWETGPDDGP